MSDGGPSVKGQSLAVDGGHTNEYSAGTDEPRYETKLEDSSRIQIGRTMFNCFVDGIRKEQERSFKVLFVS